MNEKEEEDMCERMEEKAGDDDITVHLGVGIHAARRFCVSILEVLKAIQELYKKSPIQNCH